MTFSQLRKLNRDLMIAAFRKRWNISDSRGESEGDDSPRRALPSSAEACRGSVGFQSASAGRLLLPSSDGAFCSPGLFCPSSGWSRPPRLPSSIWPWIWPCQTMLDFQSPSPYARAAIPPPLLPFSCSPVPLEHRAPLRSPSEGDWPLRSSGWVSQAWFILNSDSEVTLPWLHELLPPRSPPPTPVLTGRVWPFFTYGDFKFCASASSEEKKS